MKIEDEQEIIEKVKKMTNTEVKIIKMLLDIIDRKILGRLLIDDNKIQEEIITNLNKYHEKWFKDKSDFLEYVIERIKNVPVEKGNLSEYRDIFQFILEEIKNKTLNHEIDDYINDLRLCSFDDPKYIDYESTKIRKRLGTFEGPFSEGEEKYYEAHQITGSIYFKDIVSSQIMYRFMKKITVKRKYERCVAYIDPKSYDSNIGLLIFSNLILRPFEYMCEIIYQIKKIFNSEEVLKNKFYVYITYNESLDSEIKKIDNDRFKLCLDEENRVINLIDTDDTILILYILNKYIPNDITMPFSFNIDSIDNSIYINLNYWAIAFPKSDMYRFMHFDDYAPLTKLSIYDNNYLRGPIWDNYEKWYTNAQTYPNIRNEDGILTIHCEGTKNIINDSLIPIIFEKGIVEEKNIHIENNSQMYKLTMRNNIFTIKNFMSKIEKLCYNMTNAILTLSFDGFIEHRDLIILSILGMVNDYKEEKVFFNSKKDYRLDVSIIVSEACFLKSIIERLYKKHNLPYEYITIQFQCLNNEYIMVKLEDKSRRYEYDY